MIKYKELIIIMIKIKKDRKDGVSFYVKEEEKTFFLTYI